MIALRRTRIPLTALALAAFTREETRQFIQALAWAEQPLEMGNNSSTGGCPEKREASTLREVLVPFANWLYFQTQGQPLYLVETLKGLLAREIIVPSLQENGSWGLVLRSGLLAQTPVGELIPSSVRELIRSQLGRLTPSAWALLVAGAALGQGLTFERLIQVAQLDEQEGLRALEELLRSGLLSEGTPVEDSQAFDGFAFPREMIREVVYQEAGATRQRLLQRRVSAVKQEEKAHLLHPAPGDGYAPAKTRNAQGWRLAAGTVGGDMHRAVAKDSSGATRRHAGAGTGEHTLLAVGDWGAGGHVTPDVPRSPPGSPSRALFETRRRGGKLR